MIMKFASTHIGSAAIRLYMLCLVACLAFPLPTAADSGIAPDYYSPISEGDDEATAIRILGKPMGWSQRGEFKILYYGDRGTVAIRKGKVSSYNLISAHEAIQAKAERARRDAARREAVAAESARLRNAGMAEKSRKKSDVRFLQLPPAERLAYWKEFQLNYPEVSVQTEIADASAEVGAITAASRTNKTVVDPATEALLKSIAAQQEVVKKAQVLATSQGKKVRRRGRRELKNAQAKLAQLQAELTSLSGADQ
jgi:hypothetical protein